MPFVNRTSLFLLLLAITAALCLLSSAPVFAGDPFSLSSNWTYRQGGGDGGESSQFNESYNLTYSKELSEAMMISGSVRYSETHPSESPDSSSLNPNLTLDISNDLFSLNMNASETKSERDGDQSRTTDSWGLNLSSQIDQWPSLRLYVNQSNSTSDSGDADNKSTTSGASIEYTYETIGFLYDVRHSMNSDDVRDSEGENLDQTAQVNYDQTFFSGRVTVSASQQFQVTDSTTETRVVIGDVFDEPLFTTARYYIEDDNHLQALVGNISFEDINVLEVTEDKNLAIEVQPIILNGERISTVNKIKIGLYKEVFGVRGPLDPITDSVVINLLNDIGDWLVYHQVAGVWQSVKPDVLPSIAEERFDGNQRTVVTLVLPANIPVGTIKVVATETSIAREVFVDDVVAYYSGVAGDNVNTQTRETKSMQSQFSTTVRLTDSWSVSYNLRRAETQQDAGDTVQFNHSLSSSYVLNEKVSFSVGVSENVDESDLSANRENRSYSASMSTQPLPALSFSLGYTRSESKSDDGQDTLSDSISSTLNAIIYPDLTASLSTNWSSSENLTTGTESSTYGVSINGTAYLSPRLDMNANLNYSESDSSDGDSSRSTNYGLTMGYRPSDILLMTLNYDADIEGGSSSLSGSSNWLWSKKLQSQFGCSFDFGDATSQQYDTTLSWLISRSLSFQGAANYSLVEEGNNWAANTSLNMIF